MSDENKNNENKETQVTNEKTAVKKAITKHFINCGIVAAAAVLVMIISIAMGEAGMLLLLIGLAVAVFAPIAGVMGLAQIKRVHCKECGEKYDYDKDVAWECEGEETKDTSNASDSSAKTTAIVAFTCRCHKCGATKEFKTKFVTATYSGKSGVKRYNLNNLCKKYFNVK